MRGRVGIKIAPGLEDSLFDTTMPEGVEVNDLTASLLEASGKPGGATDTPF